MSQQRNEIINESTDKNAHKFISAIIRLIRLFCVQATTDFCSVGLFFFSFSFQEFQFYLWICAACLCVVGGTGIKKGDLICTKHNTALVHTFRTVQLTMENDETPQFVHYSLMISIVYLFILFMMMVFSSRNLAIIFQFLFSFLDNWLFIGNFRISCFGVDFVAILNFTK